MSALGKLGVAALSAFAAAAVACCAVSCGAAADKSGDKQAQPAQASPPAEETVPFVPRKPAFRLGETLSYRITLGGVPAGYSELAVKRTDRWPGGRESYYLKCSTRANYLFSFFYPVDDEVRSYVDREEFYSRQFEADINEGRVHRYHHVIFDCEKGSADYLGETPEWREVKPLFSAQIPGKTLDPLAALYYLRTCGLKIGKTIEMPVHSAGRNWVVSVHPDEEEKLELPGFGRLKTLVARPRVQFEGIFVRRGIMKIWFEKETGVPLKLRALTPVGMAEATLVKAEGIKLK